MKHQDENDLMSVKEFEINPPLDPSANSHECFMKYLFPRDLWDGAVTRYEAMRAYEFKLFFEKYLNGFEEILDKVKQEVEQEWLIAVTPTKVKRINSYRDDSLLWYTNLGRISSITVFHEEWNIVEDVNDELDRSKTIKQFPNVTTIKNLVEIEEDSEDETEFTFAMSPLNLLNTPSINEERKSDTKANKNLPSMYLDDGASKKPFFNADSFVENLDEELDKVFISIEETYKMYI